MCRGSYTLVAPLGLRCGPAPVSPRAGSWRETDWSQVVALYDVLLLLTDTPVVRLNSAVALSHVCVPWVALCEVNDLAISLGAYHLFHATRAELLDELGETALARQARTRALELCQNPAERSLLERKLSA